MCDYLNFTEIDGSIYVGDNSINYPNAIIEGKTIPHTIIIPYSYNDQKVEYIGRYAFFNYSRI